MNFEPTVVVLGLYLEASMISIALLNVRRIHTPNPKEYLVFLVVFWTGVAMVTWPGAFVS